MQVDLPLPAAAAAAHAPADAKVGGFFSCPSPALTPLSFALGSRGVRGCRSSLNALLRVKLALMASQSRAVAVVAALHTCHDFYIGHSTALVSCSFLLPMDVRSFLLPMNVLVWMMDC